MIPNPVNGGFNRPHGEEHPLTKNLALHPEQELEGVEVSHLIPQQSPVAGQVVRIVDDCHLATRKGRRVIVKEMLVQGGDMAICSPPALYLFRID